MVTQVEDGKVSPKITLVMIGESISI
jgi:hypothetical protein